MKKIFKIGRALLAAGLVAAIMVMPVYGDDNNAETGHKPAAGYFISDFKTGKQTFVPYPEPDPDKNNSRLKGTLKHDYATGKTEFIPGYDPGPYISSEETTNYSQDFEWSSNESNELNTITSRAKTPRTAVNFFDCTEANKQTVLIKYDYID